MSGAGGDEPSFDPRSWARQTPDEAAAPLSPPSDSPPGAGRRAPRGALMLAGGAIVLLVVAGGGWLALHGRGHPAQKAGPAAVAAAPGAAPAGALSRSMVIARPQDLTEALTATGLTPDAAAGIARATQAGLAGGEGELRL